MSTVVNIEPRIKDIQVTDETITAYLTDGRTISVPLAWSWRLWDATPAQRNNFEMIGDGQGVHWPDIDEDISAEGMLYGVPARRPKQVSVRDSDYFLEVDDNDCVVRRGLTRYALHHPPIHRSTVIFVLSPSGDIYFQKRALSMGSFRGCLDLVGGHVHQDNSYEESARNEMLTEFPIPVAADRLTRVSAGDGDFFRVRQDYNNENRAVFLVKLEQAEESELPCWNEKLKKVWSDILQSLAERRRVSVDALIKEAHPNKQETWDALGTDLETEIRNRREGCSDDNERRLLLLAREVEAYVPLSWADAIERYSKEPESFADGFYALIDSSKNRAPKASTYLGIIAVALRGHQSHRSE
ncbi:DUF2442 domain-containing protein [Candidatus Poribacteria bacterium]|nr:DUF2442 domain-containing protein [Candidatus Poribacteria bacterium]